MKKCHRLVLSVLVIILAGCDKYEHKLDKTDLKEGEYADEIQAHLKVRESQLELLFSSQRILHTLKRANVRLAEETPLSIERYQSLDQSMQKSRDTFNVQLLLYNACAIELKQFQAEHSAFVEIFVTDLSGMNVCQTNMTTDFYQADERWWQQAYNEGKGKICYGEISYDASAAEIVAPIYMPIYEKHKLIGLAKALVSIHDLYKTEFSQ
ncbi:cache domain-containing protein [Caedibacter taeniospiralis]|uniref:cache domain-containing protein n=1 Tax=Caedibacter taeniospiralis TaxID=28907 RepID=UPI000C270E77|nr:cache domain-containing protein [Caedibacter taeniospiralis]